MSRYAALWLYASTAVSMSCRSSLEMVARWTWLSFFNIQNPLVKSLAKLYQKFWRTKDDLLYSVMRVFSQRVLGSIAIISRSFLANAALLSIWIAVQTVKMQPSDKSHIMSLTGRLYGV